MKDTPSSQSIEDIFQDVLPKGVSKRIKIINPIDCPTTYGGAKVIDFDENGRIIDSFFENERPIVQIHSTRYRQDNGFLSYTYVN